MKYSFEVIIRPCVNFSSNSAELFVTDEDRKPIVRQKHLRSFATAAEAEQHAEMVCSELKKELIRFITESCSGFANAKP